MSGDVVIRAQGLGKKYLIDHQRERERYTALRDVLVRQARGVVRAGVDRLRGRGTAKPETREEFWALKDVDFEIRRGEVVGIIGRNGAGKSTLLKVLSRITEPSAGRVEIKGRVASLLEVGTGFHPELTGRENIFLNGAILGMTRAEIRKKFDEIVAFADVERFLDTPVKRYSSGMYVRLAFAVAAHMDPEILIIDEVLAVGDAEFQQKCLGRMKAVSEGGRTVLFVSHSLDIVARLCSRTILMASGGVEFAGGTVDAIGRYQKTKDANIRSCNFKLGEANVSVGFSMADANESTSLFFLRLKSDQTVRVSEFGLMFYTTGGTRIAVVDLRGVLPSGIIERAINNEIAIEIDNFDLASGDYDIRLFFYSGGRFTDIEAGTVPLINCRTEGYLTAYPDQWNGITKFRGRIKHLVHHKTPTEDAATLVAHQNL